MGSEGSSPPVLPDSRSPDSSATHHADLGIRVWVPSAGTFPSPMAEAGASLWDVHPVRRIMRPSATSLVGRDTRALDQCAGEGAHQDLRAVVPSASPQDNLVPVRS